MVFFLGEGHYGGGLEACGQIDNVCKHHSSEEQTLKAQPGTLSELAAFQGLVLLRTLHTSAEVRVSEELCATSADKIPLFWLVLRVLKRAYNSAHLVAFCS